MQALKTIKSRTEYYIEITDEEREQFGWKENQKLDLKTVDGGILIKPWSELELELGDFPREFLELVIRESSERDIPADQVIVGFIKEGLESLEKTKTTDTDPNFTNNDIGLPGGTQ